MTKAIVLDCFGVLYVDPQKHFYEQYVLDEAIRTELYELDKQADYGFISLAELVAGVAEKTGLETAFIRRQLRGSYVRNTELLEFAQSLRPKISIAMLSNISPAGMDSFFSPFERKKLFDAVILSAEEGLIKPHPDIYKITAQRLGLNPEDCLMVDDSLENCYGADAAGMKWIQYKSLKQVKKQLEEVQKN